jgi:phosphatidylglycerophosphate synthase
LSRPSIAELRAVAQPRELLARASEEHWAGRLYMRRLSLHVTRALIPTSVTPNAVTVLMVPTGLLAAAVLSFAGVWPAVVAALLAQFQLLLDCVDGELARWRQRLSPAGVYLDQIAHYSTEAALPAALGVRADGGWSSIGGWTAVGLGISTLILLLKAETHLVPLARGRAGLPAVPSPGRRGLLARIRPFQAIEATLLALGAAIGDAAAGGLIGSRTLVAALAIAALVAVGGHLAAVLASDRLR